MVTIDFENGKTHSNTYGLWQWDRGQVLQITGVPVLEDIVEIHFSFENSKEALRRIGTVKNGVITAKIPDELLKVGRNILAYVYLTTETEGKTIRKACLYVKQRGKPEDYQEQEHEDAITDLIAIQKKTKELAESVRKDADEGRFNGLPGKPGPKGDPGENATDEQVSNAVSEYMDTHPVFDEKLKTKLDKNQGSENAGKALVIGEDGNVLPGEVEAGGGEKDYELISEVTTTQEVAIIGFENFKCELKEYVFYITLPKVDAISCYLQRVFKSGKVGKTIILYNIAATDREIETFANGKIIGRKIEVTDLVVSKWNNGNLQRHYFNKYEDGIYVNGDTFKEVNLICTGSFKFPIGTKVTLLGR